MFQEWRADKGYVEDILQKKAPQSLSFSVSQGRDACSIKAAPTSCQSSQRAFHRCISQRPLESVSHCHHSPTGTVILDTKEPKRRQEDFGIHKFRCYKFRAWRADKQHILSCSDQPAFWLFHEIWCISGFALFFFLHRGGFNQGWPLVWINDNPLPLPPHIGEGHTKGLVMLLCAFHNNIWPESAAISMCSSSSFCTKPLVAFRQSPVGLETTQYERISLWNLWFYPLIQVQKLKKEKYYFRANIWALVIFFHGKSTTGFKAMMVFSLLNLVFLPLKFMRKHIVRILNLTGQIAELIP